MPELPEVETVVLGLRQLIVGHKIRDVSCDWARSLRLTQAQISSLKGTQIQGVARRGKAILIDLSHRQTLVIHLKLTGQLVYQSRQQFFGAGHPTDSLLGHLPDSSTRVIVRLDKGAVLYFNDVRKFGWIKLCPSHKLAQMDYIQGLGEDALGVSVERFTDIFETRQKMIKACLLDQSLLAGCGNIYADEALWGSKIHPQNSAKLLLKADFRCLWQELQQVFKLSLEAGGSSSKNYINAKGEKGAYLDFARVYQREGLPCLRCTSLIRRIKAAGRGTYLCVVCQKKKL